MDTSNMTHPRRIQSMPLSTHYQHQEQPQMSKRGLSQQRESTQQACTTIPRTQDELKHVSRIPRTPSPCEQLRDIPGNTPLSDLQSHSGSLQTHDIPRQRNERGLKTPHDSVKRRRVETIIDEEPPPRVVKRRSEGDASNRFAAVPIGARSKGLKKLQPVPANAPRDIERKGRYTFIKGVRIKDYRLPIARPSPPPPESHQYQCCDGFDSDGINFDTSHMEKKDPGNNELKSKVEDCSPFRDLPLTPQSNSTQYASTRGQERVNASYPTTSRIKSKDSEVKVEDIWDFRI